ncbi:MAG: hypothetical protein ACC682_14450 [Gemmatimonadota bacterium]
MSPREASAGGREFGGEAGDLRVHPRKRLAILEEIAADVDAMEDELAARGIPRGVARAAAIDRLSPGPAVVRELEVDQVPYRRLTDRFGGGAVELAERLGLACIVILTMVAVALGLVRLDAFRNGGAFVWGTLAAIALLVTNTLRVAWGLWVRQDMVATDRRQAWRIQVGLVLVAISIGGLGAVSEAYLAAGRMVVRADWATAFALVRDVMLLLSLGLGAGVIGLVGWLALTPSLRSYDAFERRIAALFIPLGPRLVRGAGEPNPSSLRTAGPVISGPHHASDRREVHP